MTVSDLPTPAVLVCAGALERNICAMQRICSSTGVQIWPHVKTHKLIPVLRRQIASGATGATCAKLGEAEALLAAGVRRIFLAHSLADHRHAPRLKNLARRLDELLLAVTSLAHCEVLEKILTEADLHLPVLMAVDTGLGREGARGPHEARRLAERIRNSARLDLTGIYTHEGHAYLTNSPAEASRLADKVHRQLQEYAGAVGGDLPLWPGCSVTAALMAGKPGVRAIRPGSYVFGDLSLAETTKVSSIADVALTIIGTVIDLPTCDLALIDAGSKVFSSDKTTGGIFARCVERPEIVVTRLSEEHGFLSGPGVNDLRVGDRLRFIPAHVCPVVNLASHVHLVRGAGVLETWDVDARGRSD